MDGEDIAAAFVIVCLMAFLVLLGFLLDMEKVGDAECGYKEVGWELRVSPPMNSYVPGKRVAVFCFEDGNVAKDACSATLASASKLNLSCYALDASK